MDNKYNCLEINLKDLFYVLLRKIVPLLLSGIILGIALGGYKIAKRVKTYDILDVSTKLNASESDDEYQSRVRNINKARGYVDMISRINSQIEDQRQYISDSVYMQIDADNEFQSIALISIVIDSNSSFGTENVLLTAYEREIKASNVLDDYAKEHNIKPEYLKDVITFAPFVPDNKLNVNDNDRLSALNITVIGPSSDFCNDVMSIVIDEVYSFYSDINYNVAKHNINVVGIQQFERIDESLRNNQTNQFAVLDNYQRQINNYNDSLDRIANELGVSGKGEIIEYFNSHDEETVSGIPTEISERNVSRMSMIKPAIKYGAVGFIVGFVLCALYIVFKYIFGNRFSTQERFISEFFNICIIGVMKPVNKRSRYIKNIDIKTGDDTRLDEDNHNKIIAYNYSNLVKNYKNVLITGVGNTDSMKNAVMNLELKGDYKPNMFENPDIVKKLSDYDCVVLIEQRNESLLKLVSDEIKLISNAGISIAGIIIL